MTESEFDKRLREKLDTHSEAAPDVWKGIAAGLAARRRRVVFLRVSFAAVAAAACLAGAILIFRDPVPASQPEAPVQTAQVTEPAPVQEEEPAVAPIAEQIAAFTQRQAVAQAATRPSRVREAEPQPETVTEPSVATPETPTTQATPAATETRETQVTVEEPKTQTAPEDNKLGENDLPADFWTRPEADEPRTSNAHTSQISILSNLTTVASEKNIIAAVGSNHSSSQDGSKMPSSSIEPVSGTARFFAPLSLGVQFKTSLADHLYLGTGITYSYLVSQYDLLVDKQLFADAYNQLHYLGIPLTLSYNFVDTRRLGVYAQAGGAVEKCVSQRYVYGSNTAHEKVHGVQWSLQAGIGVEYWFIPRMGIYFDPSLVYFFDNSQPLSIRTQQPLQTRFEVGFRFKI